MRARCPSLLSLLLFVLAAGGCEQLEPYRQGVHSNYDKELKQLAAEVNRDGLAKNATTAQLDSSETDDTKDAVTQANHWQTPSLAGAISLRPPVPSSAGLPDGP